MFSISHPQLHIQIQKSNNKDTKMTLMTFSCFSVDFEHINVGRIMSRLPINNIVHKSQIYKFSCLKDGTVIANFTFLDNYLR